jgi:biopolymer transport protein ExbD
MARRFGRKPEDNAVPMDMTPMIDCIFLLLIFFILTSKFTPDEKAIASLMPTDKGQASAASPSPVPKEQINIKIYPAPMVKGHQPSDYRDQLKAIRDQLNGRPIDHIYVQIGGEDPIEVDGRYLTLQGGDLVKEQVNKVHGYILDAMKARSTGAAFQKDEQPVLIHCYSGLSWKFAILAYDAVRSAELKLTGASKALANKAQLETAREVMFTPPRIRNYSSNEEGNELYEIISMR